MNFLLWILSTVFIIKFIYASNDDVEKELNDNLEKNLVCFYAF